MYFFVSLERLSLLYPVQHIQRHFFRLTGTAITQHRTGHLPLPILPLHDLQQTHARQPRSVFDGRGHHVSVRFPVVRLALHPEVLAVLVNELSLIAVHRFERVRPAFLLALLGQLD